MRKKPTDVIVIDVDEQKKRVEGYPRLETAEGNQASSMLRRLASAGNGKLKKMMKNAIMWHIVTRVVYKNEKEMYSFFLCYIWDEFLFLL